MKYVNRLLVCGAIISAMFAMSSIASAQKKKEPLKGSGVDNKDLLKPAARPKKADLPASTLPLQFIKGERIALVGNSTAERMNLFGHFETLLHARFPEKELVFRNFGRPADEVANRQRANDYTKLDDPLFTFNPDTFLCFFGFNESFTGPLGVEKFKADYEKFIDDYSQKYARDDSKSSPRFVIISPIAFESTGDSLLPEGKKENENLKLYADAAKTVATYRKIAFVDIFTPTLKVFDEKAGSQFTINGCHVNEAGDKVVGQVLDAGLFNSTNPASSNISMLETLRKAINDKSWVHLQDYRMLNGWYVYGGRRTFDTETFPREYM
ncbi:MAG: heme-binding protein, partial [Planctomycetia bacterium]|nr:heme-binding protein [Planctomycetia bacterium]